MATLDSSSLDSKVSALRLELKEWEWAFSEANGGRKASREDIKRNPDIAAKYKTYSRLRSQAPTSPSNKNASGNALHSQEQSQRKRAYPFSENPTKIEDNIFVTPRKVSKYSTFLPEHPSQLDPYDSPSRIKKILSPNGPETSPFTLRTAIGPTPQRDGKVLGLFDLLSPSTSNVATPASKRKSSSAVDVSRTPSRTKGLVTPIKGSESACRVRKHSLTPASSAKKFYLSNYFATPTTMRYANIIGVPRGNDAETKPSLSALSPIRENNEAEHETPSFLRRTNVLFPRATGANKNCTSPVAVRMPRKTFGRTLSQLVQGLRDMEEEGSKDDWDALHDAEEAEADADGILVQDSQAGTPSKTQRQWKKKGQKRTTRLVNMRPVRAKPIEAPQLKIFEDNSDDDVDAVEETQLPVPAGETTEDKGDYCSKRSNGETGDKKSGNKLVQKARKIKASAHANYRALKIRSKNNGGKGRFGGRFGRRR